MAGAGGGGAEELGCLVKMKCSTSTYRLEFITGFVLTGKFQVNIIINQKQGQQLVRCTSCSFVWFSTTKTTTTKNSTENARTCVHVFVCVLGGGGYMCGYTLCFSSSLIGSEESRVLAGRAPVVVWTAMYLTGYSDCLTGFQEPLLPP